MDENRKLPSYRRILEHWAEALEERGIFWDEPTCWACKRNWGGKYDRKCKTWGGAARSWKEAPLERCHIIPRSCGGSSHVSNIFLMCRECHELAPDTTSREMFFRWVHVQDYEKRWTKKFQEACEVFGITMDEIYAHRALMVREPELLPEAATREQWMAHLADSEKLMGLTEAFDASLQRNTGIHFNRSTGSDLKVSTVVAAIALFIAECRCSDEASSEGADNG